MEQVITRGAFLVGHALVLRDHAVADGALALSLQRGNHVSLEDLQAVNDAAVGEGDGALGGHDPALPFAFVDGDAVEAGDGDGVDGVAGRDFDDDGGVGFVDFVAGGHFSRWSGYFDEELLLVA